MTTVLDQNRGAIDVEDLVRRAAQGDQEAWEGLIGQFSRLIWSITVDFKLTESDAADVVQTTWLRLLEHIDRIEHPARVGSWLAATARNACLRSLAAKSESCSVTRMPILTITSGRSPRSTSTSSPTSAPEPSRTLSLACQGGGKGCSNCSWPIRRLPTLRSRINSAFLWGASAPPVGVAWRDCACY